MVPFLPQELGQEFDLDEVLRFRCGAVRLGAIGDRRISLADGTFQATVTCAATNAVCVLEASTNLVQWTKLSVRANTTGTVQFEDSGATNRPARFYRVVVP